MANLRDLLGSNFSDRNDADLGDLLKGLRNQRHKQMLSNKKKASPKQKEARKKIALTKAAKTLSAAEIADIIKQVEEQTKI